MSRGSRSSTEPRPRGSRRTRPPRARSARPLPRAFYARPALVVARALLGRRIVHDTPRGRVAGRIVEVEAYRGRRDPASHAFRGPTPRAAIMFGPPGRSYVYLSYGVHCCLNVVCEREGEAGAVLVRAIALEQGHARARAWRGVYGDDARLGRGPGSAARALGVTLAHSGADLVRGPLWIADAPAERGGRAIARGPRIGISRAVERPWRFWLAGEPAVSAPRARARSRAARAEGHERRTRRTRVAAGEPVRR